MPVVVVVSSMAGTAGTGALVVEQQRAARQEEARDRVALDRLAAISERLAVVERDVQWLRQQPQSGSQPEQARSRLPTR